mmetsp:Transcript_30155/g.65169  ORF Transcript_30155/g.65169 Transcript_30155/m.65169 type:complete len:161 (-) Transcript_30155:317-799(-)
MARSSEGAFAATSRTSGFVVMESGAEWCFNIQQEVRTLAPPHSPIRGWERRFEELRRLRPRRSSRGARSRCGSDGTATTLGSVSCSPELQHLPTLVDIPAIEELPGPALTVLQDACAKLKAGNVSPTGSEIPVLFAPIEADEACPSSAPSSVSSSTELSS